MFGAIGELVRRILLKTVTYHLHENDLCILLPNLDTSLLRMGPDSVCMLEIYSFYFVAKLEIKRMVFW